MSKHASTYNEKREAARKHAQRRNADTARAPRPYRRARRVDILKDIDGKAKS